jgi:HAD superfamily phosphatase (TIGR01668 family)
MIHIKREPRTPRFVPDYMAKSIADIDFNLLAEQGIRYVAFDADSTLVPWRGVEIAPSTRKFLREKQKLFKGWCIASNRITNDLEPLAESIGAGIVQASWTVRKPQRRYFKWVTKYFKAKPSEIVMIGDKLLADIFGAKRAGFTTVWVEHLGTDSPIDQMVRLRQIERRLLKKYYVDQ